MSAHADIVLVDTEINEQGDEVFVVKHGGAIHATYEDPAKACDHAAEMATAAGLRWDVTIQARNAADMP